MGKLPFRTALGLQFVPLLALAIGLIGHGNSGIVKLSVNLFAGSMLVAAVIAIAWLVTHRQAPTAQRVGMTVALLINGLCPILGFIGMILLWKIP